MPRFWKRGAEQQAKDNEMQYIRELIGANWDVLALESWMGFTQHGRGSVVLNIKDESPGYVSAASQRPHGIPKSVWTRVQQTCAEYDPATEMMIILMDAAGRGSVTPLRLVTPVGMLTPPEAYKGFKARVIDDLVAAGNRSQATDDASNVAKEQWSSLSFFRSFKRERVDLRTYTYYESVPSPNGEWRHILALVADWWPSIAASAWEGFQLAGRGSLDVSPIEETTRFVPATAGPVREPRDDLWREIRDLCRTYDPEREVVLVFLGVVPNDEEVGCMRFCTPSGWATPPEAFDRVGVVKAKL